MDLFCPSCKSSELFKEGFQSNKQKYHCKKCGRKTVNPLNDLFNDSIIDNVGNLKNEEIIKQNVKLAKNNQYQQDVNRIERKTFRDYARIENSLIFYNQELINIFKNHNLSNLTKFYKNEKDEITLIVTLADLHFNEKIDLENNKYDFTVASKRLKKYAEKIKIICKNNDIKNVLVIGLGDWMNSDRRMSEILNQIKNRAQATFLACDILQQFLIDLNSVANISVACINGNESRITEEIGYDAETITNSYDYTMYQILKLIFKNSKGIKFIDGNPVEMIINIYNKNILILHGTACKSGGVHTYIQQLMGRYASEGILISYILLGHRHSTHIGDVFSRSASLCGANDYSKYGLNLDGKASQNLILIYKNGDIDVLRCDLQNYNNDGYLIENNFNDVYNSKSIKKLYQFYN